MSNAGFITLHIGWDLPLHALNRDMNGDPKSAMTANGRRGYFSSQSRKHTIRNKFLAGSHEAALTVQTTGLADELHAAIREIVDKTPDRWRYVDDKSYADYVTWTELSKAKRDSTPTPVITDLNGGAINTAENKAAGDGWKNVANRERVRLLCDKAVGSLTTNKKGDPTVIRLEWDEVVYLGVQVLDALESPDHSPSTKPPARPAGAVDIALFGRMLANTPAWQVHAAASVSHSVATNPFQISSDSFTATDDLSTSQGAAHLNDSNLTQGFYIGSVCLDPQQLFKNLSGVEPTLPGFRHDLELAIKELVTGLPKGKIGSTNANVLPAFVLAEHTSDGTSYHVQVPQEARKDASAAQTGFAEFVAERAEGLRFAPKRLKSAMAYVNSRVGSESDLDRTVPGNLDDIVDYVIDKVYESNGVEKPATSESVPNIDRTTRDSLVKSIEDLRNRQAA